MKHFIFRIAETKESFHVGCAAVERRECPILEGTSAYEKVRKYESTFESTRVQYFRNGLLPEIDTIQYYVHVHYNVVLSYIVHTRVKYESTKVPSYDKQLLY